MKLYHGTSARHLATIARAGLAPRGSGARNNWQHTVGSNKHCVYLTNAYALHFAYAAVDADDPYDLLAIIEVEPDVTRLHADEDALEQTTRDGDTLPKEWDMKRRTIYYRARAHRYDYAGSLAALGTCGHRGPVPRTALRRVVLLDQGTHHNLVLRAGLDPTITVANYHYVGAEYRQSMAWLFDDAPQLDCAPRITRDGIAVCDNINVALAVGVTHGRRVTA